MILAAVSGGLDSVAMLWLLLGGGEDVHVHHVSMRSGLARRTGRGAAEAMAMASIVPWLERRRRPFGYTQTVHERSDGRADIVIVSDLSATLARTLGRPSLARGANAHDMASGPTGLRQKLALAAWNRSWGGDPPPIVFPVAHMTRADCWASLPPELARLTASCRLPAWRQGHYRGCGTCRACRELAAAGIPLDRDLHRAEGGRACA